MENSKDSVGILLTCHNRRETTIRCLSKLFSQKNINDVEISVYLVDDGSSDGTSDAVGQKYPQVNILKGDGSLYWTRGMRKAMKTATKEKFDYYVWLNDDTMLYENAVKSLLNSYQEVTSSIREEIIMGGSVKDPESGTLTYGGYRRVSSWHPLRFELLEPRNTAQKCAVLNGNFVIFSHAVFEKVGNLHPKLVHGEGDFEYSLRAQKRGVPSWIAPGFYGECPRNKIEGTWEDTSLSLITRYKKLFSAKGEPLFERYIIVSKYGGFLWPLIFVAIYFKPLFDVLGIPVFWASDKNKRDVY